LCARGIVKGKCLQVPNESKRTVVYAEHARRVGQPHALAAPARRGAPELHVALVEALVRVAREAGLAEGRLVRAARRQRDAPLAQREVLNAKVARERWRRGLGTARLSVPRIEELRIEQLLARLT